MPKKISEENQSRFAERLSAYLTKSGRKQSELAQACAYDPSLISKILKGRARVNLGVFLKEMAPFLVANGGLTHARQVVEMVELLGGEVDEADLQAIATAAGRQHDPLQSQVYFRERADGFRQTIPEAWTRPEPATSDSEPGSHPAPQVVIGDAGTDDISTLPQAVGLELPEAPVSTPTDDISPLQQTASTELPEEPVPTPATDAELSQDRAQAMVEALAQWQRALKEVVPPASGDELDPDEVIAAFLEWESQRADPEIAQPTWDWLGNEGRFERLRQKSRLEFVLKRFDGQRSWSQLEWEWLDALVLETARRHAGQAQLSPRQLASFVADLGQIAFEAVKRSDGKAPSLAVNLNAVRPNLPIAQGANWDWLRHIAQVGPIRLSLQDSDVCQFISREEAEFLAAQYLLQEASEDDVHRIVQNSGRPFGVLRQMVRVLHFTGRDESVHAIIEGLLGISEVIPLRYLDAARLLAACDARTSKTLYPLWAQVEETLCQSWMDANADAPEYRVAIAQVMSELQSERFEATLRQALMTGPMWGTTWEAALRDLATLGGVGARETLQAVAESAPPDDEPEHGPLSAVLSVAHNLPPTDEAALLTTLALREAEYDEQCRAVSALAQAGTLPALRALQHIAREAIHPKTRRYAETRLDLLCRPAQAALVARELGVASPADDAIAFHGLLQRAKSLLHRSIWVGPDESGQAQAGNPSRTLSRALARVWANLDVGELFRVEAALSLKGANAWPAFAICVDMLPLVDDADQLRAGLTERLLVSLAPKTATPWLWQLAEKAASPAQRAVLIRCLGRAGRMGLDNRLEEWLVQPDEQLAVAAVEALAASMGQAAAARLAQIAQTDERPGVRAAAFEGLAAIGNELALPYLRTKLQDPDRHAEACFQLAQLRHPDAEQQLIEAARVETDETLRNRLHLPALAISGGTAAVQAIYALLSPPPDDLILSDLRGHFASDTAVRAGEVWRRLVTDPAPAWRMTTIEVITRDESQALIEMVIRAALDDPVSDVRQCAQNCLRWAAPMIASERAAAYVLTRLERQIRDFRRADGDVLELLRKCLNGLALRDQYLPAEIVTGTLALLRPVLAEGRPTDANIIPLLAVLAYPEFAEAAGDVERLLGQAEDAEVQRQGLDTLIAMRSPGLFDVLIRLSRASRWPEIRGRANHYLAEGADYQALLDLPGELRHVIYQAAVLRDIRFLRKRFRQKVVFANGAWEWI